MAQCAEDRAITVLGEARLAQDQGHALEGRLYEWKHQNAQELMEVRQGLAGLGNTVATQSQKWQAADDEMFKVQTNLSRVDEKLDDALRRLTRTDGLVETMREDAAQGLQTVKADWSVWGKEWTK